MSSRRRRSPCWRAAVGGWSRLPASWASRPRCCATGAIAREDSMRGRRCPRNRRRPCLALRTRRQRSPGFAARTIGCARSATFQERLWRSSRKRRDEVPPDRRSAGCLAGARPVRCTRRIAFGLSRLAITAESPREIANRELPSDIRRVHAEHRGRYGGPRIHAELRAAGQSVSRKRIERVMRRHGIRAHVPPRSRVCTTDSKHSLPIAATLLDRNFVAEKPDQSLPRQRPGSGWRISPISRPARAGST